MSLSTEYLERCISNLKGNNFEWAQARAELQYVASQLAEEVVRLRKLLDSRENETKSAALTEQA